MPQKIDVHGLFIDPETITDLKLQKRIAVYYPVFYEVGTARAVLRRFTSSESYKHILRFDHQEPYGIILADKEQPDPASYVNTYKEATIEKMLKGFGRAGKNISGHISELLKIEISGDRKYRILQPGRQIKETSIREIPAKVRLLSGQWVDVFSSSLEYDFQGGTPYAVTDVAANSLMIATKENIYVLFGAGVDISSEEAETAYQSLIETYNEIQRQRDAVKGNERKSSLKIPQISFERPKIDLPQIKFQSPLVFGKKKENNTEILGDSSASSTEEK